MFDNTFLNDLKISGPACYLKAPEFLKTNFLGVEPLRKGKDFLDTYTLKLKFHPANRRRRNDFVSDVIFLIQNFLPILLMSYR